MSIDFVLQRVKMKIAIIVSGGPAPGINGVISAACNEAYRHGIETIGLIDGFRGISTTTEPEKYVKSLTPETTWGIYTTGGSILGTSRFNPLYKPEYQHNFKNNLSKLGVDKLIVIGGEGSAYLSSQLHTIVPDIQVIHVPKTIDNDLILPNHYPSFGFETARYVGTNILLTLKTDAKTCQRWYLVTSMGRKAGFLAIGLGVAGGSNLTIIPEEYQNHKPTCAEIADTLFQTIKKRYQKGKRYGIAVVAEGILDVLDPNDELLKECERDELGRIRYSSLELGDVVMPKLKELLQNEGLEDVKINTKNIGYELRCHNPVSFDIEYTTFLGYGAVHYLLKGRSSVMITRNYDKLSCIELKEMLTPEGKIRSRSVDLSSDIYRIAKSFMSS
jgi:ATP-dependent phosphofructokinase / diphosphate-dependent phosphofructokinase